MSFTFELVKYFSEEKSNPTNLIKLDLDSTFLLIAKITPKVPLSLIHSQK